MDEFRWIQMFVCLMLMIQMTAFSRASENITSNFMKVGDDVTLPCLNVIDEQNNCDGTMWIFTSRNRPAVELITLGQIGEEANTKSDRLSVTANCSLVIKKLTAEDAGQYSCQQYKLGETRAEVTLVHESIVDLSVITLTEQKDIHKRILNCSVLTYEKCHHTVKWQIIHVDKNNNEIVTSQTDCTDTVSIPKSHFFYSLSYKIMKCEVTDTNTGRVQPFTFAPLPSGDTITTKTPNGEMDSSTISETATTTNNNISITALSLYITGAVALVILLITTAFVIRWKKNKGNKTQMCENDGLSLKPTQTQSAPQTTQDLVEPDVSYATISYTKNTNSETRVHRDDEGDAVTYSTVKVPSSASAADPSNLYYTVNVAVT